MRAAAFPNARLTVYAVPEPSAAALAVGTFCLLLFPHFLTVFEFDESNPLHILCAGSIGFQKKGKPL